MRIGRWTVDGEALAAARQNDRIDAVCDCGARGTPRARYLRDGQSTSCGCFQRERARASQLRHGEAPRAGSPSTAEHRAWTNMRGRCENPSDTYFAEYGGRGIRVCDRWAVFENFLADMGRRPSSRHSLDRFPDNNGNYEPRNVRWATPEQQGNNKRNNLLVEFGGERLTVAEWSRRTGIPYGTLRARSAAGWSPEEMLTLPVSLANKSCRQRHVSSPTD